MINLTSKQQGHLEDVCWLSLPDVAEVRHDDCLALWRSVLNQSLEDLKSVKYRAEAMELFDCPAQLNHLCELADVPAKEVYARYQKIKEENVR